MVLEEVEVDVVVEEVMVVVEEVKVVGMEGKVVVEEVEVAVEGKLLLHSQSKLGLIAGAI